MPGQMTFPASRPRRTRKSEALRRLVAETSLDPAKLIAPFFIKEGIDQAEPVESMPGVVQDSLETLVPAVREAVAAGIRAVILFGIPAEKDAIGSEASSPTGIMARGVEKIRHEFSDEVLVITDLCLDEYTDHGHCGVLTAKGEVDNDATLVSYAEIALSHADAGVDLVAPSGMMDGQVAAIRNALDGAGHVEIGIMAYAAKFASAFYGPFRDAAESAPEFGDRRSYQIDPANGREAVREALLDEEEGADILMVKPAGPYLDIIRSVREATHLPIAAYQVSGEYSAIKAAGAAGYLDEGAVVIESLTAIRRAGAEMIITYFAVPVARSLG